MHPKDLSILDFTYDLPNERIAKFPLEERDQSKLLIYDNGNIQESKYEHLDGFLPANSLMIFNNTKVVEARLLFKKDTGATIEVFCLEPDERYSDITTAMLQKGKVFWKCMIGGASKWKHGMVLEKTFSKGDDTYILYAAIADRLSDGFIIEFWWQPNDLCFAEILHAAGVIPLPPYLHREAVADDAVRYQTIYAAHEGSVAAPTAGLHFTERVLEKLSSKNIKQDFVTLHVGAGTFKPVKSETLEGHEMHSEFIEVSKENIQHIINHLDRKIIAVGTTSLRTIETLFWMGLKLLKNENISQDELVVKQWDPYELDAENISVKLALETLLTWMEKNRSEKIITKTQILIAPGYDLKIADGIVTNFHQPQSTLLLLISAFVGDDWKKIYTYAMENDFRFLSFGDGCLLWKKFKNK